MYRQNNTRYHLGKSARYRDEFVTREHEMEGKRKRKEKKKSRKEGQSATGSHSLSGKRLIMLSKVRNPVLLDDPSQPFRS